MVKVNTVYQTVLALANKEQRGYVTPQEFNLFANQAQMEIFEQYFYDLNQFKRVPGNDANETDMVTLIDDKVSIFSETDLLSNISSGGGNSKFVLPTNFYRLVDVRTGDSHQDVDINKLSRREFWEANQAPLTRGTTKRPNFYMHKNEIWVNNGQTPGVDSIYLNYLQKPSTPKWGYVVVGEKPLYAGSRSTDFELHDSEQKDLVIKILQLAGISIKDYNVAQVAGQKEANTVQQEKS